MSWILKKLGLQKIEKEYPEPRAELVAFADGGIVKMGGRPISGRITNWRFAIADQISYGPAGPMAAIFYDIPPGAHYASLIVWDAKGRVSEGGKMVEVKQMVSGQVP